MSIKKKLLLLVLLLSLIPTAIVGFSSHKISKEMMSQKIEGEFRDRLGLVMGRINGKILDLTRNAENWSNQAVMKNIVNRDKSGRINEFIISTVNAYRLVKHITVFNRNREIVSTTNFELTSDHFGIDRSTHPLLRRIPLQRPLKGQVYAQLTGRKGEDYILSPVYALVKGKKIINGAIFVELDRREFSEFLQFANEGRIATEHLDVYFGVGNRELHSVVGGSEVKFEDLVDLGYEFDSSFGFVKFAETDYVLGTRSFKFPIAGFSGTLELTALQPYEVAFSSITKLTKNIVLIGASLAALFLILGLLVGRNLVKPVIALKETVEQIVTEGVSDQQVCLTGGAETRSLGNSINLLLGAVKDGRKDIEKHNIELEQKILDRTSEIIGIKEEVSEMLHNMKQGIYTFDSDLKVNPNYSDALGQTLGAVESFKDKNAIDILFSASESNDVDVAGLKKTFEFCFGQSELGWQLAEESLPENLVLSLDGTKKIIKPSIYPIMDNFGNVKRIMMTVDDVTALERSRKRAAERLEKLEKMLALLEIDESIFESFVADTYATIDETESLLNRDMSVDNLNEIYRMIHTVKGNARLFKLEKVESVCHESENLIGQFLGADHETTSSDKEELFASQESVRSELDKFVALRSEILGDTHGYTKVSSTSLAAVHSLIPRLFEHCSERGDGELDELKMEYRAAISTLGRKSIDPYIERYDRMLGSIAEELEKQINPIIVTGNIRYFESKYLRSINQILIHCLRNTIDHGIESPEIREERGKPKQGSIVLDLCHKDGSLEVRLRDDGNGIDVETVAKVAIEKGIISSSDAASLSDFEKANLITAPGFSTAEDVTEISGRGVGMDAVKGFVQELGGDLLINSTFTKGTTIQIKFDLNSDRFVTDTEASSIYSLNLFCSDLASVNKSELTKALDHPNTDIRFHTVDEYTKVNVDDELDRKQICKIFYARQSDLSPELIKELSENTLFILLLDEGELVEHHILSKFEENVLTCASSATLVTKSTLLNLAIRRLHSLNAKASEPSKIPLSA